MKTDPATLFPQDTRRTGSLTKVLGQSEHIRDVVEECAEDLSSVNTVLKQGLAERHPEPALEKALEKSENVESRVLEAAEELSAVNHALENEVQERQLLEHQLAAAREQEEAARHAAFHDPLTGLPNRVLFNDRLEHGLAQAKRHGWTLAVMFVDLDDFKSINDTYGHDAGDGVLRILSRRLRESTRSDDTVSRHGGDEFLYLLMEICSEQDVVSVAEKIIDTIQQPCELSVSELTISPSITASIGIALYPKDGATPDDLVKMADKAMYRAKRTRSGYAFAR